MAISTKQLKQFLWEPCIPDQAMQRCSCSWPRIRNRRQSVNVVHVKDNRIILSAVHALPSICCDDLRSNSSDGSERECIFPIPVLVAPLAIVGEVNRALFEPRLWPSRAARAATSAFIAMFLPLNHRSHAFVIGAHLRSWAAWVLAPINRACVRWNPSGTPPIIQMVLTCLEPRSGEPRAVCFRAPTFFPVPLGGGYGCRQYLPPFSRLLLNNTIERGIGHAC